jgi:Family of unknown function (DUF6311)
VISASAKRLHSKFDYGLALGLLGGLIGFAKYQSFKIVDPRNVQAFIAGDWGTHMLGWLHFRNSPALSWPLGMVPSLGAPSGTSLAFTDSIPLIAFVLRPFSGFLPTNFQYLGIWILIAYLLQGYYGARIVQTRTNNAFVVGLGASLFVVMPAFLIRNVHPALSAHWLILAILSAGFEEGGERRRRRLCLLTVLCPLLQAYLWFMVVILYLGYLADAVFKRKISRKDAIAHSACSLSGSLFSFWLFGFFSKSFVSSGGEFGTSSADLWTYFNPRGFSRLFKSLDQLPSSGDGIAYLGAGVLAMLLCGLCFHFLNASNADQSLYLRLKRHPVCLGLASVSLAIFSLTNHVRFLGREVLDLTDIYSPVSPLANKFYSASRADWPLMYGIVCVAIFSIISISRHAKGGTRRTAVLMFSFSLIQFLDLRIGNRYVDARDYFPASGKITAQGPLEATKWDNLTPPMYRRLELLPATLYGCAGIDSNLGYNAGLVARLSLRAYTNRLTFNSGYFSRQRLNVNASCTLQNSEFEAGMVRSDSVYVTLLPFSPKDHPKVVCETIDGLNVCVKRTKVVEK